MVYLKSMLFFLSVWFISDASLTTMAIAGFLGSLFHTYPVYKKSKKVSNQEDEWLYEIMITDKTLSRMTSDKLKQKGIEVTTGKWFSSDVDRVLVIHATAHNKIQSDIIINMIPKGVKFKIHDSVQTCIKK